MIPITAADTTTIDATFEDTWSVSEGVAVSITGPGIDATGAVTGRSFYFHGTFGSDTGPVMTLGDASLADSDTFIEVDYRGTFGSGGAGLVALSGGVTFNVTGDDDNGTGLVRTVGLALDFRQGGNTIKNDGTIRSTSDTAIQSAGTLDSIENNGTITADRHGIVSAGEGIEIGNNGTLAATRGYGILSTGDTMTVINNGTITAGRDGISAAGDGASITNSGTITSSKGAAITVSGADAVIETTTRITGKTHGIQSTGANVEITQGGVLRSQGVGIEASGDGSHVDMTAHLTGVVALVLGGEDSIATNLNKMQGTSKSQAAISLTGNSAFTNEGAVSARSGHAISAAGGDNSIINTGSLHGDVKLGGGNDWLSATAGVIDGKVYGGKGDDVYEVGIKLRIVEKPGEGIDTVRAMFSWTLAANIENLELSGSAAADAKGNALANILTGNAGDNRFWGLGGADTFVMQTGGGTDQIMDFQNGKDIIDFAGVDGITGFADIAAHMAQSGRNVVIDLSGEPAAALLVIRNVDIADLNDKDFQF